MLFSHMQVFLIHGFVMFKNHIQKFKCLKILMNLNLLNYLDLHQKVTVIVQDILKPNL